MRISQDSATQISKLMTETKAEKVRGLLKEFEDFVTAEYIRQTPKEIIATHAKFSGWFDRANSIILNGNGFNHEYVNPSEPVIAFKGYANLTMADKVNERARKLYTKWNTEDRKLKELRKEIRVALINLRTFAQIQKNLPEAIPYLPKSGSVELMVNLDDLRSKIAIAAKP